MMHKEQTNTPKLDPIIEILKKEFEAKKQRNGAYSLRAFARFLEIDPSNLSKIMSYQIIPGERLKRKIAHNYPFILFKNTVIPSNIRSFYGSLGLTGNHDH